MVDAKRFFPAFIDLEGRLAVVIGSGSSALKRVRQLIKYEANVVVVTPEPEAELVEAQDDGKITLETRGFVSGDLTGAFVVFCIDTDPEIRAAVHAEAESRGCLLNVNGAPELCNFLVPSIFRRDQLEVAISTGGVAPPVAKALRKRLERDIGEEWSEWIQLILDVRSRTANWDDAAKARALNGVTDPAVLDKLRRGRSVKVDAIMDDAKAEEPQSSEDAEPEQDATETAEEPAE